MKTFLNVLKIIGILAAIAAAVYVAIAYGDKIVAWFKKTFAFLGRKKSYRSCENNFSEVAVAGAVQADDNDFAG